MANKNILGFNLSGSDTYYSRPYGTCSTAAATAAKTVTWAGFILTTGATILVKFSNANSASSPTLNVNSTGAKTIIYHNAALTSSLYYWSAGDVCEFVYDGTYWVLMNVGNNNDNSWRGITDSYSGTDSTISLSQKGANSLYNALVNGNADGLNINSSSFSVSAAGWYKLAYIGTTDARGSVRLSLYTTGGSYSPKYTELKVSNGWSVVDFTQYGRFDWISAYRYTTDSSNSYIEAYFTGACDIYLSKIKGRGNVDDNNSGWTLYSTATAGSGTIAQEATHYQYCGLYSNNSINGNGFVKIGSNDNYMLLGGGGHKLTSDFAAAGHTHTISQITNIGSASVNYASSAGSATSATSATNATNATYATSAGNADTVDNKHASDFASADKGVWTIKTFTKSLKPTTTWQDTGIISTDLDGTGSYMLFLDPNHSNGTDGWVPYYTGTFVNYSGTNGSETEEIILQAASHASYIRLFLRWINTANSLGYRKLQIRSLSNYSNSYNMTFKIRRII